MGLTRTSSGLVELDAFGSDTIANYTPLHEDGTPVWAVAGGNMVMPAGRSNLLRDDQTTVKCVTTRFYHGSTDAAVIMATSTSLDGGSRMPGYWAQARIASDDIIVYKRSGGAFSSLGTAAVTLNTNTWYTLRVYTTGSVVVGKCGATTLGASVAGNDATYSAGAACLRNTVGYGTTCSNDWLEARTAHTVRCTGLTTGYYLKVSDGTTTAKAAESSGTATVDAGAVLFPLASVGVYDGDPDSGGSLVAELDTGDYADMGGGDAFAYSSDSALWLPNVMKHNLIGLGGFYG